MGSSSSSGKGRKAGSCKSLTVDMEALFRELQKAPKDESGAMTTQEIMDATGLSRDGVWALLANAKSSGKLTVVKVPRLALDGAYRRVPGYILNA